MEKSCKKCPPKARQRPFLTVVNNPKQPLHGINSFQNETF